MALWRRIRAWRQSRQPSGPDPLQQVLEGHLDSVTSVVFSHDSKVIASASFDKTVRVWNVETGKCEQVLEGHINSANSVVFSHDSKVVASASDDKTVRIWDIETGGCKQVLEDHSSRVYSVVFSRDSKIVASTSDDRTVRIWSTQSGNCGQILKGHSGTVWSVVFSHDSKMVASSSDDKTVRIWSVETGDCKEVISVKDYSKGLSFTADSRGLITSTGIISLTHQPMPSTKIATRSQSATASLLRLRGDTWITMGGKDLLWLPAECRGGQIAISGNTVAVGCQSGRVILLGFSDSEIAKLK